MCSDSVNPLSANPEKWSNTLKEFVGNLPTNCLSVFDHFMNLALKGLMSLSKAVNPIFHDLLIAKMDAYDFSMYVVTFFCS